MLIREVFLLLMTYTNITNEYELNISQNTIYQFFPLKINYRYTNIVYICNFTN